MGGLPATLDKIQLIRVAEMQASQKHKKWYLRIIIKRQKKFFLKNKETKKACQ